VKDVVRLEIYPIFSGDKEGVALANITAEEKRKIQDKEKKLKLAREQINKLKMENTQMLEEKKSVEK